jgi:hypothetical protein
MHMRTLCEPRYCLVPSLADFADSFQLGVRQKKEDQTGAQNGDDFKENGNRWSNNMVNRNSLYAGTVVNVAIHIIHSRWV